jgi:hypothetical protein
VGYVGGGGGGVGGNQLAILAVAVFWWRRGGCVVACWAVRRVTGSTDRIFCGILQFHQANKQTVF